MMGWAVLLWVPRWICKLQDPLKLYFKPCGLDMGNPKYNCLQTLVHTTFHKIRVLPFELTVVGDGGFRQKECSKGSVKGLYL